MKKFFALMVAVPLLNATLALAEGPFTEKDFKWEPFTNLYKRVIIAGANKIARTNPDCAKLDPASLEHYGGTPDDPEFVVTCGDADHPKHVHFTKTDITGDPASNVPLEE